MPDDPIVQENEEGCNTVRPPLDPHDYERNTRHHYQSEGIAARYLAEYEGGFRLSKLAPRLIAWGERRAVRRLLLPLVEQVRTVVDVPCGTGKLHSMFADLPVRIVVGDVSGEMMRLALRSYVRRSMSVAPVRLDVLHLPFADQSVDCTVCLRLLHRVPSQIRRAMLREIVRVTRRHAIISVGVVDAFQRTRLRIRRLFSARTTVPHPISPGEIDELLTLPGWHSTGRVAVIPGLSAEVVYRLSATDAA